MDTENLTYRELADRLGVKLESARKTVQRRRWMKVKGNDGTVRVSVPVEYLVVSNGQSEGQRDEPSFPYFRELEIKLEGLQMLLQAETRRADEAAADRDRWHALATRPWWKRLAG